MIANIENSKITQKYRSETVHLVKVKVFGKRKMLSNKLPPPMPFIIQVRLDNNLCVLLDE